MTKIVWRLKEQPSSESLRELVKDGLLTKDEAREILFTAESKQDRDVESLKEEIKFLRDIIATLGKPTPATIIETIRVVEKPIYIERPWYKPYEVWCGGNTTVGYTPTANFNSVNTF